MSYILNEIPTAVLDEVVETVNKLSSKLADNAIKVKDEDRLGVRTMAQGREGLARLVAKVATQYENHLARADKAADLAKALDYYSNLESARQAVMALMEFIDGTQWGDGADCMAMVDRFAETLQGQRGSNSGLDAAMNEIDDWNKRYANRKPTEPNPPPLID